MYFCKRKNKKMDKVREIIKTTASYILAIIIIPVAIVCKIFRK